MLDIKFIRENKELVKQNIRNKFQEQKLPLVDEVVELDEKIRSLKLEGDNLRGNRNSTSALIDKTHENGSPWSQVYIPNKNVVIPQNLIKKYFSKMPAMRTVSDSLQNIPTIGYINDEGYTVLPKRYDD